MKRSSLLLLLATPWLVAATPTEVARLDQANLQRPTWSPDGSRLSWEANFHQEKRVELYVGTADGNGTRVTPSGRASSSLTAGFSSSAGSKVAHELTWAPASMGAEFVYAAANDALDYDLYVSAGSAIAQSPAADGGAAWSPDGSKIAFTSARSGQGDLYLIDVSKIEQPPRQLTTLRTASEVYVAWSHDSQMLAWVAHGKTGDNLWLLPKLTGSPLKITAWAGNQVHPVFSPSAHQIAFYANHEDIRRNDLYVVDATDGAQPRLLVRGVVSDANGPAWSPDGSSLIVVLDDDERFDPIARVELDSGATTVLRFDTVGNGDLSLVDRDGTTWLAWVAQGRTNDPTRSYDRLFVTQLDASTSKK
ncbi:MAG: hypothetical protein GWP91_21095 [Rhodobacterales bacterium]|nr:hypothetical protein [Rhodobacterales bacterium]